MCVGLRGCRRAACTARGLPPRNNAGGRALSGPELELPLGLRDEHRRGRRSCRQPAARASASSARLGRVVDEVVDESSVERRRRPSGSTSWRAAAGRRGVDEHVPAAGRRRQRAGLRRSARAATARAASGAAREIGHVGAAARRAPPRRRAPRRRRRARSTRDAAAARIRPRSGARKPSTSVLRRATGRRGRRCVLIAPTRLRDRIDLVHERQQRDLERRRDAGARAGRAPSRTATKSAASAASSGR